MSRTKIITKSVKDKNISDMFNQMLGAGSINLSMCYPKYDNIKTYLNKLLEVLNVFNNSPLIKGYNELEINRRDINKFITKSRIEIDNIFNIDLSDYEWNLNLVDDKVKEEFEKKYNEMKESDCIFAFIKICDNLVPYRKHLGKSESLNCKFIENMAGSEFCPFPFSNMNIKYIVDNLSANNKENEIRFILIVLNKILSLSYNMYKVLNSPDFDVEEFSQVIINNLKDVKKRIPRCEKAFKKIEDSVGLLKENFGGYYKDFIQTQNQMIIMENFISDVAKNTEADPETTRQFRQIITYYKKLADQQIKNPKVKQLFDKVNENFNALDKHENIVSVKSLSDNEEDEEDKDKKKKIEDEKLEKEQKELEEKKEKMKKMEQEYMSKSVHQVMIDVGLSDVWTSNIELSNVELSDNKGNSKENSKGNSKNNGKDNGREESKEKGRGKK